ncbi:MAG TPA: histidinol-phosphate transaminase [Flavisolibacter sp.]|nr:histidinol-phosphate transaminase [Flavisolibacter sp.]
MSGIIHRRSMLKLTSILAAGFALPEGVAHARKGQLLAFSENTIRLTSNENPYGPSPMARRAMADAVSQSNRYPWDVTTKLREKLGAQYGLSEDNILMGAGSSEILGLVAQLAALNKGNAITAAPAFSIWIPAAEKLGLTIIKVPLTEDKKHDLVSMLSQVTNETRLFYICNPNNPTGTTLPSSVIKDTAEEVSKKSLVLIDEAYLEYTDDPSMVNIVNNNKNIIIAKTFSKIYGLAGARIGYAVAHPDTIEKLASLQPWGNAGVSTVSLAAALASLNDKAFVANSKEKNTDVKLFTQKELSNLGIKVIPSHTNFIYYSLSNYQGNWQEALRAKNILSSGITEKQGQWTRTTIGTMDEMKQFISATKTII